MQNRRATERKRLEDWLATNHSLQDCHTGAQKSNLQMPLLESAAGPTASVVAATLPFSIGTETEGSLMSPAATCGSSSMRPSLGSVGRSYVMMLADSLVRPLPTSCSLWLRCHARSRTYAQLPLSMRLTA